MINEAAGFTNYTPYTEKQQLFLKNEVSDKLPEVRAAVIERVESGAGVGDAHDSF